MNRHNSNATGLATLLVLALSGCGESAESPAPADPAPAPEPEPVVEEATDERPNILFILADDMGYMDAGFMGGEISTPNIDALAADGLRLMNFHAAPTCAPSRAMLMSGMTPPEAGVRVMDDPLHADVASLPERLQAAGYATYMAGKWNLGKTASNSPAARGFDRSFALMKAGDNHLGASIFPGTPPGYEGHPAYLEDGQPVDLPEGWFSSQLYTDKLLEYLGQHDTDTPWFGYLALTAPHWPLQVPEDWIDRYAGRYDMGYDAVLQARLEAAKGLSVFPDNLEFDGYDSQAERWDDLPDEDRAILARSMEIYAAMVENMDMHIGRVLEFLEETGQLENTVIVFTSDNGPERVDSSFVPRTLPRTDTDNSLANQGREGSYTVYGPGWAEASMAPYRALKGTLYTGGTLVPTVVNHGLVDNKGGMNHTYLTVMDLLPTFLDIADAPEPTTDFQGRAVRPVRGASFWGLVTGEAGEVRDEGIMTPWIHLGPDNTALRAVVRWPWKVVTGGDASLDAELDWELYNLETDPGERTDVSAENPELVAELTSAWLDYGRQLPAADQ